MAYVWRNGFWRDSVTGDIFPSVPPPIQVSDALSVEVIETTYVSGSIYIRNWPALQKAREDTASMTWVSTKTAAPSASAVQADTGSLAAGSYDFDIQLSSSDTVAVGKGLVVEHRNAANGATLFNLGGVPSGGSVQIRLRNYAIALNERIRVIAGTAAGATNSMYVAAIGRRSA